MTFSSRLGNSAVVLITLLTAIEAARAGTPREFLPEAQLLLANGACGSPAQGPAPVLKLVAAHCKVVTAAQVDYREKWLAVAKPFFAEHVPATIPKTVVYPFAGGDLATALTVFPDADEITTLSLEPAGDPRGLAGLRPSALKKALATAATELSSLYRHNYSVTLNMVGAMRGSTISTQLLFGLSALWVHGHELVGMRYFTLSETGELEYFDEAAIAAIDAQNLSTGKRNAAFGNVELRFRKQGSTHEQIYRHIQANLDDAHIKKSGSVLKHLEKKGKVAGMTKAASYLLTFNDFAQVRNYLIDNVQWMVSDSTGIGPKFGTPAGFVYETYGKFDATNMPAGNAITPFWKTIYKAQPARKLPFRFGYPDRKNSNHLIIMRRA